MKNIFVYFIVILHLFYSCDNKNRSVFSNPKIDFPKGLFSYDSSKDEFYANALRSVLLDLNESGFDKDEIVLHGYRLIAIPAFSNVYMIKVAMQSEDSTIHVEYKRLEFQNIAGQRKADIHLERKISLFEAPEVWPTTVGMINEMNFWELDNQWECDGADGTIYILEGLQNGEYHLICRWTPELCKFDRWHEFLELVEYFKRIKRIN